MKISKLAACAFSGVLVASASAQTEIQSIFIDPKGIMVRAYSNCHEQNDIAAYLKQKFNQEKINIEGKHEVNRATLYVDPVKGSYSIVIDVNNYIRLNRGTPRVTPEQLDKDSKVADSMACVLRGEESGYPDRAKTTEIYKSVFGPE